MHDLLDSCREGDRQAFTELVVRLQPWAMNYAASMLADDSLAMDAVQESMIILYQRLGQLRSYSAFIPWMRSILRSQVMRILRRRPEVELAGREAASPTDGPLESLELEELRRLVQLAIAELTPASRQTVEMFYIRERSVSEVSLNLGIPQGTVRRRLHDARRQLRELLVPREGIVRGSEDDNKDDNNDRINL